MSRFRIAAFAAAFATATGAFAAVPAPTPTPREDVPFLARERARAVARFGTPSGVLPPGTVPDGAPGAQRFDPQVTGTGAIGDRFGSALALSGDTLLVGAFLDTVVVPDSRNGSRSGTVSVYRRVGAGWEFEAILVPAAPESNEQAGIAVALDGDVAVTGARAATEQATFEAGAAHVFVRQGTSWSVAARLVATPPQVDGRFGEAVAVSGDTIAVGAPRHNTAGGVDAGAVFVFRRNGASWPLVRVVTAPDGAAGDAFGSAVALAGDALFVGAPLDDEAAVSDRGSVYAFTRTGDAWPFAAKTPGPGAVSGARFGAALAIDASRLAVGAPGDALGGVAHGTATLYSRSGVALSASQPLVPPDGASGDAFGTALSLGVATVLVGAPDRELSEGAAYAFVDGGGGAFAFQAVLSAPDGPFSEIAGAAVALLGDEALLGASLEDLPPNRAQGAVQRYARSGSTWSQLPRLDTGDGAAFEAFGQSVSTNGARVAVGAFLDDSVVAGDDAGSVTVFRRDGAGWTREARLEATDAISQDRFGIAVNLAADELLVGSYFNVVAGQINRGAVYAFARSGGTWVQSQKLATTAGAVNDFFGFSLARDGDRLLVGAPGVDVTGENAGAAYIFERGQSGWSQVAQLAPPPGTPNALAGISVALEGDIALVGGPEADIGEDLFQGVVHVFVRNAGTWSFARTIVAPDGLEGDFFGSAVALDGTLAIVGASGADQDGAEDGGAAYAYALSSAGETLLARFGAPVAITAASYGFSVALDRDRVLIGAPGAQGQFGEIGQGRAWLAPRAGTQIGVQAVVEAPSPQSLQFFGHSVALAYAQLAVGAPEFRRDNPREGAAYAITDPDRLFADGFE